MEWTNKKVIAFLEILQTEPCLWDPRLKSFKNRASQSEAWRNIMKVIPFKASINDLKKKKESLMGYYRTHLKKWKKSLNSDGKDDIYTTNWFAYETMDAFLREIYENKHSLSTEINDFSYDSDATKESDSENDEDTRDDNFLYLEINEAKQTIQEVNPKLKIKTRSIQDANSKFELKTRPQSISPQHSRKRKLPADPPEEIWATLRQMDETLKLMIDKKEDENDMFGKLIASKLKQIKSPNLRDILMNDIQNLVFRSCMADRLEQSAVPISTAESLENQVIITSVISQSSQLPSGNTTSLSLKNEQELSTSLSSATSRSQLDTK